MVANVGKFKGKMAENGYNNSTFARAMGISDVTLKRKINDNDYFFNLKEIIKAKELLSLKPDEFNMIFFGENLN